MSMRFDPKVVLASRVEGLSPRDRRPRGHRLIVLSALLLFLVTGTVLAVSPFEDVFSHAVWGPSPQTSTSEIDLFRKMSFLPLAGRTEAANFFLKTLDGQNRSLSQDKGNIILMNFWATWCPPCIREMPAMQRAYDKFKDRGFQIIAISVDLGNSDAVRKFTESLKLNFQVLLDPENRVKQAYRVRALPTTYLIDRAGRVVAYGMGAREWDSEAAFDLIAHLLKEKG
jgi:peroxiredoxin